ncbi:MAG: cobalamin biosynthesis central domain-containing protein [Pseudanabaenaceae cyanobacterium SKYGB_i_bin29]|nr:hypothetical protein [Pseudanabaenaceae cyanobacterium SKYG29]MDW8422001.1 cobalamin biosynthesis central domain-containing protein [Pseudanabaenaceae cyanobacterium SKYGB_i_bin29]
MVATQVIGIAVTAQGREILDQIPWLTLHDPIDDLRKELAKFWQSQSTIVFCLPLDKVVKLIAPYLGAEPHPNVIVIDTPARYVISLLGTSYLVEEIANLVHGQPIGAVVTTRGIIPADRWGIPWGWRLGKGDWQGINQKLEDGSRLGVVQEVGSELWKRALPPHHSLIFYPEPNEHADIFISHRYRNLQPHQAQWHPRVLWLGLVCAPDTPAGLLIQALQTACQIHYLADLAIAGVVVAEANDRIADIAQQRGWVYQIGTTPDAEALARQGAGQGGLLIAPSQSFQHAHHQGSVTIAIALASQEYIPGEGYLGIIPNQLQALTLQERECLLTATVIMAESLPDQFRYGKIVETQINYPLAVSLAQRGLRVTVVNDRADLVFAHLLDRGWQGRYPRVEVIPGVSHIQTIGAKLGIVLQENFCVINLHGGQAGEGVLQRRVEAAAISDLLIVVLEPCTPYRLTPLILSLEILRHYRSLTTPVALVKGEKVTITQLQDVDLRLIDRDTTLLIGNDFTQFFPTN